MLFFFGFGFRVPHAVRLYTSPAPFYFLPRPVTRSDNFACTYSCALPRKLSPLCGGETLSFSPPLSRTSPFHLSERSPTYSGYVTSPCLTQNLLPGWLCLKPPPQATFSHIFFLAVFISSRSPCSVLAILACRSVGAVIPFPRECWRDPFSVFFFFPLEANLSFLVGDSIQAEGPPVFFLAPLPPCRAASKHVGTGFACSHLQKLYQKEGVGRSGVADTFCICICSLELLSREFHRLLGLPLCPKITRFVAFCEPQVPGFFYLSCLLDPSCRWLLPLTSGGMTLAPSAIPCLRRHRPRRHLCTRALPRRLRVWATCEARLLFLLFFIAFFSERPVLQPSVSDPYHHRRTLCSVSFFGPREERASVFLDTTPLCHPTVPLF